MDSLTTDDENDFKVTEDGELVVIELKNGMHGWGQTKGGASLEMYRIAFQRSEIRELIIELLARL